jgi:hypothetical protein
MVVLKDVYSFSSYIYVYDQFLFLYLHLWSVFVYYVRNKLTSFFCIRYPVKLALFVEILFCPHWVVLLLLCKINQKILLICICDIMYSTDIYVYLYSSRSQCLLLQVCSKSEVWITQHFFFQDWFGFYEFFRIS